MSVLFLILAIFICIPYWLLLIFMGDNFRHQDKISSVLTKDISPIRYFNIVTTCLHYVKFVLLWQKYCYFRFFFATCITFVLCSFSIGISIRVLALNFFRGTIFSDLNDNIWQVKKLRILIIHKFDITAIIYLIGHYVRGLMRW